MTQSKNITWYESSVSKEDREQLTKQKGVIIWFTGLSGSGKSTLSSAVEKALFLEGHHTYRLDGDNIRHGLNSNLGFSPEDRTENIRRIGEVAKLMIDAGLITLTAFISPYAIDRQLVRDLVAENEFIEVYVKASLGTCEERDVKGLYKKARAGELKGFTGIDSPYEEPISPEIIIDTETQSVEESVAQIIHFLKENAYFLAN